MKRFTKDEIEIVIKLLQTDLKLFKSALKNSSLNTAYGGQTEVMAVSKLILSLLKFEDDTLCAFDYTGEKGLINDERCILLKAKLEESK